MDEELTITLKIANRFYPIKINREDEEDIRKAGALINKVILIYKDKYPLDSETRMIEQDYLACAITHLALKLIRCQKDTGELEDVIADIDNLLEKES